MEGSEASSAAHRHKSKECQSRTLWELEPAGFRMSGMGQKQAGPCSPLPAEIHTFTVRSSHRSPTVVPEQFLLFKVWQTAAAETRVVVPRFRHKRVRSGAESCPAVGREDKHQWLCLQEGEVKDARLLIVVSGTCKLVELNFIRPDQRGEVQCSARTTQQDGSGMTSSPSRRSQTKTGRQKRLEEAQLTASPPWFCLPN